MAEKEFMMRLHGDFAHRVAIYTLKDILIEKGAILKDERQFKKLYHSPCEPDAFFEYTDVFTKNGKKTKVKVLHVVEIETRATPASLKKKQEQYEVALAGVRMTPVNLSEFINLCPSESSVEDILKHFREEIELRLPI
jgi:hypothetical protein